MKFSQVPGILFWCWFLTCFFTEAHAQTDTLWLDEVIVHDTRPSKYLPGGKSWIISGDSLGAQDLSQALSAQGPVYFVQYGAPGQLSSINLRGLGASRSSLVWQGMEINSYTLGQTDFGEIALGTADEIRVRPGAVGALFGNGALGGIVEIGSKPRFDHGHSIYLDQSVGSFGFWGIGVGHKYSNKQLSVSSKLIHRQAKNDFPYLQAGVSRRQHNAGFNHYSFLQDVDYILNKKHLLSMHFWYNHHQRDIQPHRNDLSGTEQLKNENTRITGSWVWQQSKWTGKLQTGYSRDHQLYNQTDRVDLDRWFGAYELEWAKSTQITLKAGLNVNHLIAKVDAYERQITETRHDFFSSLLWKLPPKVTLGLSIRAPAINGNIKSTTPLLSASYQLIKTNSTALMLDLQISRGYRLPTLNNRYWRPGGNSELKAENSRNLEGGLEIDISHKMISYQGDIGYFRHRVDNWIIWVPGGREQSDTGEIISFWFPDNIREVLASGFEYHHHMSWKPLPKWHTDFIFQGVYNKALNKKTISPLDRSLNKQLPYTPLHVVNGTWQAGYQAWSLGMTAQYRSQRFVETNNELPPLPAYVLWNIQAGKTVTLGAIHWHANVGVYNLMNRDYESFQNRAMPGRNYRLSIKLSYNN